MTPGLVLLFFLADPIPGPPMPPVVRTGGEPWIRATGVGGLRWGTSDRPPDVRTGKTIRLPDAKYTGLLAEDLAVDGPRDEERFVRYFDGQLRDAWWVTHFAIDASDFSRGTVEWAGAMLGPQEADGWFAVGDATSWDLGKRTALLWIDRDGMRQILVSRAKPTDGAWAVERAKPIVPGARSKKALAACLPGDGAGDATVDVRYDERGRLSGIRSDVRQPVEPVIGCFAGLLSDGPAETTASVEIHRKR